jgi:hypothetical protein
MDTIRTGHSADNWPKDGSLDCSAQWHGCAALAVWPIGNHGTAKNNLDMSRQPRRSVYIEIMMRCTKMVSLIALVSAFAGGLAFVSLTGTAAATRAVPDLCVATGVQIDPSQGGAGCVYSDSSVPVLSVDVCWDGTTARIKGGLSCPAKQATYHVKYGDVINPTTGEVLGYAPLPDACEVVACEASDVESLALEDGVACCNPDTGDCWAPDANGNCLGGGEITWCKELEENPDNSITCHEE